jgi:hypothetical protein
MSIWFAVNHASRPQTDPQALTSACPVIRRMYLASEKMTFFMQVGLFRPRYPNLNTLRRAKPRMFNVVGVRRFLQEELKVA